MSKRNRDKRKNKVLVNGVDDIPADGMIPLGGGMYAHIPTGDPRIKIESVKIERVEPEDETRH